MTLDPEKCAESYAGKNFRQRRTVQVEVLYAWTDAEWTYEEFVDLLQSIPEEHRATVSICFECGWRDESDKFTISYERLETDEELEQRVAKTLADAVRHYKASLTQERQQYEALKGKFEEKDSK